MRVVYPIRDPLPIIDVIVDWSEVVSTQLNSMGQETQTITAPVGYAYQLLELYFTVQPPTGASWGDHSLYVEQSGGISQIWAGESDWNSALKFEHGYWGVADRKQYPSATQSQIGALRSMWAYGAHVITLKYGNMTDGNTTETRTYKATLRRVRIV